jgi:putative DNA methylase
MFTHKATGAWDALTTGLMKAGFVITASWPINTEAEGSLHIKDKSAANSTIFLACRPRQSRQRRRRSLLGRCRAAGCQGGS